MTTVVGIAACLSALTSLVAVAFAYRANLRAIEPSILTVARSHDEGDVRIIQVRIHNGGPGLARDVVAARSEPTDNPEKPNEWMEHDHTAVIRILQSGESIPAKDGDWLSVGPNISGDDVLGVVVRYSDTRGVRHQMSTPLDLHERTRRPRPVKPWWRRKRDKTDW